MPAVSVVIRKINLALRHPGGCVFRLFGEDNSRMAVLRPDCAHQTIESRGSSGISRMHALLPDGTMREYDLALEPECELMLSLSQHGSCAGKFPLACRHVTGAIGVAGAVERIKRVREIRTIAVLDCRK